VAQFTACAMHAIPAAQLPSAVQGPGTHSETDVEVQGGGSQASFGAQAMSGQASSWLVWQMNPFTQSASFAHDVSARAASDENVTTVDASRDRSDEEKRGMRFTAGLLGRDTAAGSAWYRRFRAKPNRLISGPRAHAIVCHSTPIEVAGSRPRVAGRETERERGHRSPGRSPMQDSSR
jgi:hypothetical protein